MKNGDSVVALRALGAAVLAFCVVMLFGVIAWRIVPGHDHSILQIAWVVALIAVGFVYGRKFGHWRFLIILSVFLGGNVYDGDHNVLWNVCAISVVAALPFLGLAINRIGGRRVVF